MLPVLGLAFGTLLVSNIVLQSAPVRRWCAAKLDERSGLDWTIGSLSWTPWTGVQVGEVKAELHGTTREGVEPLYEISRIDVLIYWRGLLRGRVEPREVRMRGGRVAIPLELSSLLPRSAPQAEPSETAQAQEETPPLEETPRPTEDDDSEETSGESETG